MENITAAEQQAPRTPIYEDDIYLGEEEKDRAEHDQSRRSTTTRSKRINKKLSHKSIHKRDME